MDTTDPKKKKLLQALQDGKIVDDKSLALYQILDDASAEVEKMDKIKQDISDKVNEVDTKISEAVTTLTEEAKSKIEKEIAKVEMIKGDDGDDYILTEQDKADIAGKIKVPVVEKITHTTETIREQPIVTEITKEVAVTDTAEEIVAKINDLPVDEDEFKIDYSHIKNVPKQTPNFLGTQGPNTLFALSDVDVTGLTAGQSIEWDGVRWIPYTPAGGASTDVFGEVVSVTGTSFTLAHTPVSGTVRLYRGGAYQQVGIGNDYTLSGATGTLAVGTNGEVFMADYKY